MLRLIAMIQTSFSIIIIKMHIITIAHIIAMMHILLYDPFHLLTSLLRITSVSLREMFTVPIILYNGKVDGFFPMASMSVIHVRVCTEVPLVTLKFII
jgi:hypothetical protein